MFGIQIKRMFFCHARITDDINTYNNEERKLNYGGGGGHCIAISGIVAL